MENQVSSHSESHRTDRINWLRAAVLGANDGVISVSSLVVGIAASNAPYNTVLLSGFAGLVAGAISMAAGEYVSVFSQADTESAELEREKWELENQPRIELEELTEIYVERGLDRSLAEQVAKQLTAHNALEAHARDELGITETLRARPLQAALSSGAAFSIGASVPVLTVVLSPHSLLSQYASATTVLTLLCLGGTAAHIGGASIFRGAVRVTFWGVLAMLLTAVVGKLFNASGI